MKKTNQTLDTHTSFIDVKNLIKTYTVKLKRGFWKDLFFAQYKSIHAVNGVSFSINKGEIVGFIGPNGAGKTTTLKMLCGILWPTSGKVIVDGLIPYESRKKHVARIGAVFGQKKSFWPELSIYENLELLGAIYSVKNVQNRIRAVEHTLGLSSFISQPFRKLSLGQQMKAELAGAILHEPHILFLDEPTIGMDIIAKAEFMSYLKKMNTQLKTTIILTSHDLHEIELLCKCIIIINSGNILYDGMLEKIRPSQVLIRYETKGRSYDKLVERSDLKTFLAENDFDDLRIEEVPIEEIIKKYYHI
jgi:ABC-2 type transport system ATP-binding protein